MMADIFTGLLCSIPVWLIYKLLQQRLYVPLKSNLVWDKYVREGKFHEASAKLVKWHSCNGSYSESRNINYEGKYEYTVCGRVYRKSISFSDMPPDEYTIYYRKGKPKSTVDRYNCCRSAGIVSWLVIWLVCSALLQAAGVTP